MTFPFQFTIIILILFIDGCRLIEKQLGDLRNERIDDYVCLIYDDRDDDDDVCLKLTHTNDELGWNLISLIISELWVVGNNESIFF